MKIQEDLKKHLNLKSFKKEFKKKKSRGRHVSKKPTEVKGVTFVVNQIADDTAPPSNALSVWQKGGEDWRIIEKAQSLESDNLPCDKCQINYMNGMVWASDHYDPRIGCFHLNCNPYHTIKIDDHIYQVIRDGEGRIFKRLVTKELLESEEIKPPMSQKRQIVYTVFFHIVIMAILFTIAYNV